MFIQKLNNQAHKFTIDEPLEVDFIKILSIEDLTNYLSSIDNDIDDDDVSPEKFSIVNYVLSKYDDECTFVIYGTGYPIYTFPPRDEPPILTFTYDITTIINKLTEYYFSNK